MALFSSWFKSKPDGSEPADAPPTEPPAGAEAAPPPLPPPVAAVRTVRPNPVQPVRVSGPRARSPISLTSSTGAPASFGAPPRKISFGGNEAGAEMEAPSSRALPTEPPPAPANPDAVVHLVLGDFVDRIPTNFLNGGEIDRAQGVDFLVSELYSDLAKGRATVPASIIYLKCPEIFARPVSDTEDVEVHLPLHRLVEQMGATFTPRQDQMPEESVAEIETPFLQVALEDNARLPKAPGTSVGATVRAAGLTNGRWPAPAPNIPAPVVRAAEDPRASRKTKQISPISPLKQVVEARPVAASAPPTAQTAGPINPSKRPPATVRASVAGGKIRLSAPTVAMDRPPATPSIPATPSAEPPRAQAPAPSRAPSASPSHQVTKKTARIQIPPISLRPAAAGAPRPPTTPSVKNLPPAPPRPVEPLTSFKPAGPSAPSSAVAPTFRSTPPPPSYVKPPPPSFSPTRPAPPVPETSLIAHPPVAEKAKKEPAPAKDELIELSLSLASVLRGLPSTALVVEPTSVPDSARLTLPFALVEPQLSNGRVSVSLAVFRAALPSAFNHVLAEECDLTEVPIPLQEVFQNLPANALSQREDQIIEEARNSFPTPFSQKAEEDARRFGTPPPVAPLAPPAAAETNPEVLSFVPPAEPAPAPVLEPAPPVEEAFADEAEVSELVGEQEETPAAIPDPQAPSGDAAEASPDEPLQPAEPLKEAGDPIVDVLPVEAPGEAPLKLVSAPPRLTDTKLQTLFMTEDELDAKTIARLASQLPGIDGCSVMFDDGLLLATSQAPDGQTEGFSAMAPALFQKVLSFTVELSLGELEACTLYTGAGLLSLFTHGNICLSVRHSGRGFLPGVREKLAIVTRELAAMYAPPPAEPATESARE